MGKTWFHPPSNRYFLFTKVSNPALESTRTSYPMGTRPPPLEVNGQNVMLITHLHSTLHSRIYGFVPPLPVHLHYVISGHTQLITKLLWQRKIANCVIVATCVFQLNNCLQLRFLFLSVYNGLHKDRTRTCSTTYNKES